MNCILQIHIIKLHTHKAHTYALTYRNIKYSTNNYPSESKKNKSEGNEKHLKTKTTQKHNHNIPKVKLKKHFISFSLFPSPFPLQPLSGILVISP